MIKKISAMVADIDGTLTMKGGELMPHTKAAIQRLHEEGVQFGIASGRPLDDRTKSKAEEWGLGFDFDMMIGMNGGDLWTI
jgi:HAD superfamily hydrolase (TIGR01484 family)